MNVIGLLRHGPTAWNREKRIQGTTDIPLDPAFDPTPWLQVLDAHGPWDRVVTSPLARARETAGLLFPGRGLEISAGLMEQDWGEWTGLTVARLRLEFPGRIEAQEALAWDFTPPGGESRREVLARALAAIAEAVRGRDGERILLVTHLGVIKIVLNHLLGLPFLPGASAAVAKRALHLLAADAAGLRILQTNVRLP
ncbi:Acid phosphatase [anaerobic digester metagenome]